MTRAPRFLKLALAALIGVGQPLLATERITLMVGGIDKIIYLPVKLAEQLGYFCLLYTSPSPRDRQKSRMPSSA